MTPPTRSPHPALAAWTALRDHAGGRGALVTLVRTDGGNSKPVGAHLALAADGRTFGSVTILDRAPDVDRLRRRLLRMVDRLGGDD